MNNQFPYEYNALISLINLNSQLNS